MLMEPFHGSAVLLGVLHLSNNRFTQQNEKESHGSVSIISNDCCMAGPMIARWWACSLNPAPGIGETCT